MSPSLDNASSTETPRPDRQAIIDRRVPARWYKKMRSGIFPRHEYALSPLAVAVLDKNATITVTTSERENRNETVVVCQLCPHECKIQAGSVGRCSARENVDGTLVARTYGRPAAIAIDPIEKKPLYHFLLGTPVLSFGSRGCNLSCQFCQNWKLSRPTIKIPADDPVLEPFQIAEYALQYSCPCVAFTYNEPTIWAEYIIDAAAYCRAKGIRTVVVTNGMIIGRAREELYSVVDAVNVDLKSFTDSFYRQVAGGNLDVVKSTLVYLARSPDVWLEVTNLIIPGHNDSVQEIRSMCDWFLQELGPDVPLHFSAFFPAWKFKNMQKTNPETLVMATQIAREIGIRYVYRGNVSDESGQTTYCPRCGEKLIRRFRYQIEMYPSLKRDSDKICCEKCGETIPGIFR